MPDSYEQPPLNQQWIDALRWAQAEAALSETPESNSHFTAYTDLLRFLTVKPPVNAIAWRFTHDTPEGRAYSYHDLTEKNDYRHAHRDDVVEVIELFSGRPDMWKNAVTDAMTVNHLDWTGMTPREAVAKLLEVETQMALDPSVSAAAKELVERGRANAALVSEPRKMAIETGYSADPRESPDIPGFFVPHYGVEPYSPKRHNIFDRPPKSTGDYLVWLQYNDEELEGIPVGNVNHTTTARLIVNTDRGRPEIRSGTAGVEIRRIMQYAMIPDTVYYYAAVPAPAIKSVWRHRKGSLYRVELITNLGPGLDSFEDFPPTVCYRRIHDGQAFSRPLVDWYRSFTEESEHGQG